MIVIANVCVNIIKNSKLTRDVQFKGLLGFNRFISKNVFQENY